MVAFVNELPNGAAIEDGWVLHHRFHGPAKWQVGVHHMKAWAVFDGERLVAWIGGVDLNNNRTPRQDPANYWHDVQAEVEGEAAEHVYELLRKRWETHPAKPPGTDIPSPLALRPDVARQRARIVATFGDPTTYAGLGPPGITRQTALPYPFASHGSTAYRQLVAHCIAKARRFIYLEDQYLIDESIAMLLAEAMPHLSALMILMPVTDGWVVPPYTRHPDGLTEVLGVGGELRQAWARRKRFLNHLAPHRAKVAICTRERFVHAKTWIFDDTVAVIGSANVNRRGFKHDSEAAVAFGDITPADAVRTLRLELWNRHLATTAPPPTLPAEKALPLWQNPPSASRITRYNPDAGKDRAPTPVPLLPEDWFWDNVVDPDCPPT